MKQDKIQVNHVTAGHTPLFNVASSFRKWYEPVQIQLSQCSEMPVPCHPHRLSQLFVKRSPAGAPSFLSGREDFNVPWSLQPMPAEQGSYVVCVVVTDLWAMSLSL
jgi:hypothetical protein